MPTNNSWNSPACSFSAYKSAPTLNVTGNGAIYAFVCDTEISDIGSNYAAGTGIFTAPVTGNYLFNASVLVNGGAAMNYINVTLVTPARNYLNARKLVLYAGDMSIQITQIIPLTAGDTCYPTVTTLGEAADTDDVYGGAQGWTTFDGTYIGPN